MEAVVVCSMPGETAIRVNLPTERAKEEFLLRSKRDNNKRYLHSFHLLQPGLRECC
jgi:hypothetical protein